MRAYCSTLTWRNVSKAADGKGLLVTLRRSKTDQKGTTADVRYLKNGAALAVWALRPCAPDDDDLRQQDQAVGR